MNIRHDETFMKWCHFSLFSPSLINNSLPRLNPPSNQKLRSVYEMRPNFAAPSKNDETLNFNFLSFFFKEILYKY